MKRLLTLAILTSLALSYTAPVMAIENTVLNAKTEKSKVVKPNNNKYEYINLDWWKLFNDEHLNGYVVKAVENNKDLKMATLTIDEYYQNVIAQRAGELPQLQAGFMPGYGNITGKTDVGMMLPLVANYEIDLFGKNHNKTTSVRKLYEASILDEKTAYISIASAVGSTYINIVKLDSMVDLQEDIVKLRKEIFEIMSISNAEGIVSTSDLVKANQSYIQAVTDLTDYKKERTKLLHALAVLTGDSPNNIEEYSRIDYKTLAFSGTIPEFVSSDVIMNRPDYLKAEKMLEKAGIDVKVARKECLPTLNLGGMYLFNAKDIGSLLTTSNALWSLGGGIMQPIFMGGKIKANLKSKKIAYEKSLRNYEKVNLTSMQEVNDSLVSINMDKEKLARQKKIQELEQKDFELSKLKFKEGVIAKLDLNQREENLLSVNKMVYASEFDCMVDYISYYKAIAAQI
ncbi:MAG: TolC family protein [Candidatus Gastranaerophilales bacterium]|nr:TolC family protein [Candidatus Gastranaerophilales bacterium]MCM1072698.1 TolC family protein [Bacteroides sp.]